jgi:hypothetical protein
LIGISAKVVKMTNLGAYHLSSSAQRQSFELIFENAEMESQPSFSLTYGFLPLLKGD